MEEKYRSLPFTDFSVTFEVHVEGEQVFVSSGATHSAPTPFSMFGIWAIPPGIPVGSYHFGRADNVRPHPSAMTVVLGSDQLSMWARRCPHCTWYWRTEAPGLVAAAVCPYCGKHSEAWECLSEAQEAYVEAVCAVHAQVTNHRKSGKYSVYVKDLLEQYYSSDDGQTPAPPEFFVETEQQSKFKCDECGMTNNILGRFGYCSTCGTRNDIAMLRADITGIRKRLSEGGSPISGLKDLVSKFDSLGRRIAQQLLLHVRMVHVRRSRWKDANFSQLASVSEDLKGHFGIDIFRKVDGGDQAHARLMFHRRHVHEHNDGIIDAKYLEDSGDTSVRLGEHVTESMGDVMRLTGIVDKMAANLMEGFNQIMPVHELPIRIHKDQRERMNSKGG
ncbi:MAG: hypothetical protein DI565_13020 [Ancylobacter novellus]|uniref:Uncharacterized protein n=1 Tax=Ancylobacter novellus TaxID=921 RepID=A0A2W5KF04_ANCNO|nr:MAG: hypothetical protein DI565_13020 [Ancylobacter novellus]